MADKDRKNEEQKKHDVKLEDLPVDESAEDDVKGGAWLATPAGSRRDQ